MMIISEYSIDGIHPNQLTSARLFIDVLVIHKYCNSSICAALVQKQCRWSMHQFTFDWTLSWMNDHRLQFVIECVSIESWSSERLICNSKLSYDWLYELLYCKSKCNSNYCDGNSDSNCDKSLHSQCLLNLWLQYINFSTFYYYILLINISHYFLYDSSKRPTAFRTDFRRSFSGTCGASCVLRASSHSRCKSSAVSPRDSDTSDL